MTDDPDVVIVLDQFRGPTPHALSLKPQRWRHFLLRVDRGDYNSTAVAAERTTVADLERTGQRMATTAYRCGPGGTVQIWRMRWDSSG